MNNNLSVLIKHKAKSGRLAADIISKVFIILFIFGVCYLFLFPLIYLFSTAFQSEESLLDPTVLWIPNSFSLDRIKTIMELLNYKDSSVLTAVIAVFSTLMSVISCSLVGYGFARFNFKLKGPAFALVVLTIIMPVQVILIPSYINFRFFDFGGLLRLLPGDANYLNLLETPWTFILPAMFACGLKNGLFIFIFRQSFAGMPKELEEAAQIDGCGAFSTFLKIMLPLAKATIVTVIIFSFVWHWNDYYSSTTYFVGEVRPIMAMIGDLTMSLHQEGVVDSVTVGQFAVRSYFACGALLAVLPPLILYVFLQRYFVESIEKTGIVG